jgi:hypothetical protein
MSKAPFVSQIASSAKANGNFWVKVENLPVTFTEDGFTFTILKTLFFDIAESELPLFPIDKELSPKLVTFLRQHV